jgi:hypothetical protein
MKLLIIALILLAAAASSADAQTTISVDINRAKLVWQWSQGAPPVDGIPTEFLMKCGQSSGNYNRVTPVIFPLTELAVRTAIGGTGRWFCAVSASNPFGESGLSNEVFFDAGAVPLSPSNLAVQAQ